MIQWATLTRTGGTISDFKTYTYTIPTAFNSQIFAAVTTPDTANAVFGISKNTSTKTTVEWSVKPNHDRTSVDHGYLIIIGY